MKRKVKYMTDINKNIKTVFIEKEIAEDNAVKAIKKRGSKSYYYE